MLGPLHFTKIRNSHIYLQLGYKNGTLSDLESPLHTRSQEKVPLSVDYVTTSGRATHTVHEPLTNANICIYNAPQVKFELVLGLQYKSKIN